MSHFIDNITVEGLTDTNAIALGLVSTATANGTQTLTVSSKAQQVYTGSTSGQLVKLPDATTLVAGHTYWLWNDSTVSVTIQNATPTTLFVLPAGYRSQVTVTNIGTAAGSWDWLIQTATADLKQKAGSVSAGTFAGNPKTATVTFTTAFADANYSVTVLGQDGRSWKYQSKIAASFIINTQANTALTASVDWIAVYQGET